MSNLIIGGVETFSAVDFPGKLAAVIFMQGCPWRCPFCHNAELQPIGEATGFIWEKFIEFLQARQGKLDAVVFSGGEPLVQAGLADAIQEVKALGYQIGLHTGGYRPARFAEVLPLVDWVGFDIKAPFEEERYLRATHSHHLKEVLQSLQMLLDSGKDYECRTTCDPRFLTGQDLLRMAQDLHAMGVKNYYLQKYRPIASDKKTTDADCENIFADSELINYLQQNFSSFEVRK